jgi:hypothetical protein
MTCEDCTQAATRLWHGFRNGCPGCAARAAARSPPYRAAQESGRRDRHYRGLLQTYGVTHDDVRAAAAVDARHKETA